MKQNIFSRLFLICVSLLLLAFVMTVTRSVMAAGDDYARELSHVHFFKQSLIWVGKTPPSSAESKELFEIFDQGTSDDIASRLENFIKTHPDSPWVPSLEANLGVYYYDNGYFTSALDNWQSAWTATYRSSDWKERTVADYTLVNMLHLLASLGRTETLKELLNETRDRLVLYQFKGHYDQYRADYQMMLRHPEFSYRCGTFALDAVAQVLFGTNYFKQIWEKPSPPTGFSMADLVALSDSNHLNMVAVERSGGDELVVPSVLHWKQNHYAAIVAKNGDFYKVVDPTFQISRWLKGTAINAECSGQFLVSAKQVPAGWRVLSQVEAGEIFGKGFAATIGDPPCCPSGNCPCTTGPGGGGNGGSGGNGGNGPSSPPVCSTCSQNGPPLTYSSGAGPIGIGMPEWTVLEPWCTVWLKDEPLAYQPAKGPRISFDLSYWSQGHSYWPTLDQSQNFLFFTLPSNWTCSWLSYVDQSSDTPLPDSVKLISPDGGLRTYSNLDGTVPEFSTNTRMLRETNSQGVVTGYRIFWPSGAQDVYEQAWNPGYNETLFFRTEQINPNRQATTFVYTNNEGGG